MGIPIMKHASPGYILVLTLLIISASVILVSRLINRSMGNKRQSRLLIDREKAKMIALGGLQIAISQLSLLETTTTAPATTPTTSPAPAPGAAAKPTADQDQKKLVAKIVENTNRWQKFILKEPIDSIDGELELYISSEAGKINLNSLYNFNDKKFMVEGTFDAKKIVQLLAEKLKPVLGESNFAEVLERFLKAHDGPVDDITELGALKEFKKIHEQLFIAPTSTFALTDLFTAWGADRDLQPLLISTSLGSVLGFKKSTQDAEKLLAERRELAKKFKTPSSWAQDWDKTLAPLYGKEYTNIPQEIKNLLSTKFEVSYFSVVSYGKIGTITQKVYAILEKEKTLSDNSTRYIIKKLYWL